MSHYFLICLSVIFGSSCCGVLDNSKSMGYTCDVYPTDEKNVGSNELCCFSNCFSYLTCNLYFQSHMCNILILWRLRKLISSEPGPAYSSITLAHHSKMKISNKNRGIEGGKNNVWSDLLGHYYTYLVFHKSSDHYSIFGHFLPN